MTRMMLASVTLLPLAMRSPHLAAVVAVVCSLCPMRIHVVIVIGIEVVVDVVVCVYR